MAMYKHVLRYTFDLMNKIHILQDNVALNGTITP